MNNQEMLSIFKTNTFEANSWVMRVVVSYGKGQKHLKKKAQHVKSGLARPSIYDQAYLEKVSKASPGNPVGVTRLNSFSLIVQQHETSLEESTSPREDTLRNISPKNPWQKFAYSRNLHQNSMLYTMHILLFISVDKHHLEAHWTTQTLEMLKFVWKLFFYGNFRPKICGKITKRSAKNWTKPMIHNDPLLRQQLDATYEILGEKSATK